MDAVKPTPARWTRVLLLLFCLLLPTATSGCHVMNYRVGMGANGTEEVTMQQYYMLFGLIRLNEVDVQRVVGDLTSYDVEVGFSYRTGFWNTIGDFMMSMVFLPLTVTRQAITVKY